MYDFFKGLFASESLALHFSVMIMIPGTKASKHVMVNIEVRGVTSSGNMLAKSDKDAVTFLFWKQSP
jgi:hypothetical protein